MTKVTLDATLRNKLLNLTQPLEICDEERQMLGRLFPLPDLSQYEPWEPAVSEQELRRREQSGEKRYTTAEVLAHLEKL